MFAGSYYGHLREKGPGGEQKKKLFFSILVTSTYGTYSYDHQDLRISTSQNENYWSKHPHQCNFSFNSPNWRPPNLVVIFMRTKNLKTISIQFLGGNYGLNYPDPFQIFTRSWHVTSKPSPQKNPAKHSRTSRFGKGYWAKMVEAWFMDKESEFHQILPRMIQVKKESRKNQKCIIISVFVVDSSFAAHGICKCVWIKIDMRTNQTTMECDFVSRFFEEGPWYSRWSSTKVSRHSIPKHLFKNTLCSIPIDTHQANISCSFHFHLSMQTYYETSHKQQVQRLYATARATQHVYKIPELLIWMCYVSSFWRVSTLRKRLHPSTPLKHGIMFNTHQWHFPEHTFATHQHWAGRSRKWMGRVKSRKFLQWCKWMKARGQTQCAKEAADSNNNVAI